MKKVKRHTTAKDINGWNAEAKKKEKKKEMLMCGILEWNGMLTEERLEWERLTDERLRNILTNEMLQWGKRKVCRWNIGKKKVVDGWKVEIGKENVKKWEEKRSCSE